MRKSLLLPGRGLFMKIEKRSFRDGNEKKLEM
jgi:hypothetical protein